MTGFSMMRCGQLHKSRQGFNLTELAIALGIIGLVLGAIWSAASAVYAGQRANKAAQEALAISGGYQSVYGQRGIDTTTAWADVTCLGINSNFFPSDMIAPGTTCTGLPLLPNIYPRTPWGGSSSVAVLTYQANNTFLIQFSALTQDQCLRLSRLIYTSSTTMTYQAVNNGNAWTSQWLPPYGANTPWNINTINGLCGANSANIVQIGLAAK